MPSNLLIKGVKGTIGLARNLTDRFKRILVENPIAQKSVPVLVEVVELAVEEVERNLGGQAVLRPTRMLLNVKLLKELASIKQFSTHTPS